mgnify:CR=1 FL=1
MREIIPGLWQGDISDLNVLKLETARKNLGFTLAINVADIAFVPPHVPTIVIPMQDVETLTDPCRELNPWPVIVDSVTLALDELERGGKILVACAAGLSRSVTFIAMMLALRNGLDMREDRTKLMEIVGGMPSYTLWDDAANALEVNALEANREGY